MISNEFIALAASLGACASALAGFFTVREIAKQRQATFQPEIVPSSLPFAAEKNPLARSGLPDKWVEPLPPGVEGIAAQAEIPIINIGMGAARHAELKWNFDIESAVHVANILSQESLSATFFELANNALSMKSADDGASTSMWSNQQLQRFDYILPASGSAFPVKATIPHAYCQLVAAIVYFSGRKEGPKFPKSLPQLKLDISYLDIAGSRHEAKYIFSTEITMIVGRGEAFQGRIESARCS